MDRLWTLNFADVGLIRDQGAEETAEDLLSSGFVAFRTLDRAKSEAVEDCRKTYYDAPEDGQMPEPTWVAEGTEERPVYRWTLHDGDLIYTVHTVDVED